ncbi:MAG: hypothetical protein JWR77_340, partial [Rhizorhabdus sp.]|nr:hypothetical protein [Rhizorhabdus sp.]
DPLSYAANPTWAPAAFKPLPPDA